MKILITGGCGFVGATLARSLLARGQLAGRALGTLVLAGLLVVAVVGVIALLAGYYS